MPKDDDKLMVSVCQLQSIRSTTDGGWRISFDLPGNKETNMVVAALGLMRDRNVSLAIRDSE